MDKFSGTKSLFDLWARWCREQDQHQIFKMMNVPHSIMLKAMQFGQDDKAPKLYVQESKEPPDFRPYLVELFMSGDWNSTGLNTRHMDVHQALCARHLRRAAGSRFAEHASESVIAKAMYPDLSDMEAKNKLAEQCERGYTMLKNFWDRRVYVETV